MRDKNWNYFVCLILNICIMLIVKYVCIPIGLSSITVLVQSRSFSKEENLKNNNLDNLEKMETKLTLLKGLGLKSNVRYIISCFLNNISSCNLTVSWKLKKYICFWVWYIIPLISMSVTSLPCLMALRRKWTWQLTNRQDYFSLSFIQYFIRSKRD